MRTGWLIACALVAGCDLPGRPDPARKFEDPAKVLDFAKLYAKHCLGCHGVAGKLGPAPPLNDAVFLAIVPESVLTQVITEGRKGTSMPAFAKSHGGTLRAEQVQALAAGLHKHWQDTSYRKSDWPEYLLTGTKGDKDRGKAVFARVCAGCHGKDGRGGGDAGTVNDPAFLDLASEQVLRRLVITGRADLGMPNCAENGMTAADVNDVVALLVSWKR